MIKLNLRNYLFASKIYLWGNDRSLMSKITSVEISMRPVCFVFLMCLSLVCTNWSRYQHKSGSKRNKVTEWICSWINHWVRALLCNSFYPLSQTVLLRVGKGNSRHVAAWGHHWSKTFKHDKVKEKSEEQKQE